MAHSKETDGPSPPVSPLRRAINILTSRGLPSPELRDLILDGSAVDLEEDESSSTPFLSPQPSPSPSRQSLRRNTGSGSGGGSPLASLRRLTDATVSLVRSKSSGDRSPAGHLKRQYQTENLRHGRAGSLSDATSRSRALQLKGLLFTPPGSPPSVSITTQSPSRAPSTSPRRATVPLPALNMHLESFPFPLPSPMSSSILPPLPDEQHLPIPVAHTASAFDLAVPDLIQRGTPMIKVSGRKQTDVVFRLDPDQGQIIWESKKHRISARFCLILRFNPPDSYPQYPSKTSKSCEQRRTLATIESYSRYPRSAKTDGLLSSTPSRDAIKFGMSSPHLSTFLRCGSLPFVSCMPCAKLSCVASATSTFVKPFGRSNIGRLPTSRQTRSFTLRTSKSSADDSMSTRRMKT